MLRAAFKIVAANLNLKPRGAFKIVAFFLHHGTLKVYRYSFASFDFPCLKNEQLLGYMNP